MIWTLLVVAFSPASNGHWANKHACFFPNPQKLSFSPFCFRQWILPLNLSCLWLEDLSENNNSLPGLEVRRSCIIKWKTTRFFSAFMEQLFLNRQLLFELTHMKDLHQNQTEFWQMSKLLYLAIYQNLLPPCHHPASVGLPVGVLLLTNDVKWEQRERMSVNTSILVLNMLCAL